VLCMMVYFFNEQKMLTVSYNPFWMLLWDSLFTEKRPSLSGILRLAER
jgi:hypothetical protein